MASQIAFPYTFPFDFHTGTREETGAGVEALQDRDVVLSDESGGGIDASSLLASLVKAETGAGVEAVLSRAIVLASETGQGVDALASLLVEICRPGFPYSFPFYFVGERGSGVDASTLLAALERAETGEGVEATLNLDTLRALRLILTTSQYRKVKTITG